MALIEVILIALGLSMDAFAVSMCKGVTLKKVSYKQALIIGLFFGGFQAIMPLIGWFLGSQFADYITFIDHWIAFILLFFIGGKMIYGVIKDKDEENACGENIDYKNLFLMAIATSIDALAVGITFAFLKVNIILSVSLIGCITFVCSFIGVFLGRKFGAKYKQKAELAGGIVLIFLGTKILLEHLIA